MVGRIKTFQVEALAVPLLKQNSRERLALLTDQIIDGRDKAANLLREAETVTAKLSGLPGLPEFAIGSIFEHGTSEVFEVSSTHAQRQNGTGSEFRLDAHFYNPTAQLAVSEHRKMSM